MHVLQNWRAYLPAKERLYEPLTLLLIALLILGTFALVLLLPLPKARTRGALQAQMNSMAQSVALEKTVQSNAPTRLANQIQAAETQVVEAAAPFLSESEASLALNQLYQYARLSNVTIVDLKAQAAPEIVPAAISRVLRFNLQVTGALPELMNFLARIEQTERAGFAVTNVAIQAEKQQHRASMDLALYISPYAVADASAGFPPTPLSPLIATAISGPVAATPIAAETLAMMPSWPTLPALSPVTVPVQAACPNLLLNGDFETMGSWLFGPSITPPQYTNSARVTGTQAIQLGVLPQAGESNRPSYSSIRQLVTIPATAERVILYWWQRAGTQEAAPTVFDLQSERQEVLLLGPNEQVLAVVQQRLQTEPDWQQYAADLTQYRGQSVYLYFNVFNNGNSLASWLYLDGLVLQACGAAVTPFPTQVPATPAPPPAATTPAPATFTPILPTATTVPAYTYTPPATPGCANFLRNGGFESTEGWLVGRSGAPAQYVSSQYAGGQPQAGSRSMQLGRLPGGSSGSSYSSIRQLVTIPSQAQTVTLRWWQWAGTEETALSGADTAGDRQELLLLTPDERLLAVMQRTRVNHGNWQEARADLSAYRGQTLYLYFNVFNDSDNLSTWLYLDEVTLTDCDVPPVSTPGATSTPVPSATSIPLPTLTATPASTATNIISPLPTPTMVANCTELLTNGSFENNNGWRLSRNEVPAEYTTDQQQAGIRSVKLGLLPGGEGGGFSSIQQTVTIPGNSNEVILRWWQWAGTEESTVATTDANGDRQEVLLLTQDGRIRDVIQRTRQSTGGWQEVTADLSDYRNQTLELYFNVVNDKNSLSTWLYLDEVTLLSCQ